MMLCITDYLRNSLRLCFATCISHGNLRSDILVYLFVRRNGNWKLWATLQRIKAKISCWSMKFLYFWIVSNDKLSGCRYSLFLDFNICSPSKVYRYNQINDYHILWERILYDKYSTMVESIVKSKSDGGLSIKSLNQWNSASLLKLL